MYSFFVGCDVSKRFFDVSYYRGKPIYLGQFSNDIEGFKQMVTELQRVANLPTSDWFLCFENTGVYSKALLEWLISQQIACKEENALVIARSKGVTRGKNDQADAKVICMYCFEKRDSLKPSQLAKPELIKLKKLLSRRDLLVREKQSISVSLKDQKQSLDPTLQVLFENQNQLLMTIFSDQIKEVEMEIEKVIKEDPEMRKNDELAQSVVGIGLVTSAYMIATTLNFTAFSTARQFASYSGIAPFLQNQSGDRQGSSRVSHLANKKLKSLLSMGVLSAIRYDQEIGTYYERKLEDGKKKGVVLNAVKNKLVQRVFATVKRQTPYVKLATYR